MDLQVTVGLVMGLFALLFIIGCVVCFCVTTCPLYALRNRGPLVTKVLIPREPISSKLEHREEAVYPYSQITSCPQYTGFSAGISPTTQTRYIV